MNLDAYGIRSGIALAALLTFAAVPTSGQETTAPAAQTQATTAAAAEEDKEGGNPDWFPGAFSANVNWATDYVFRGVSQTNEHGALQGGIDWAYELSPYFAPLIGSWGSNVDFQDGDDAQLEIDIYGGFTGAVEDFSYGALGVYYEYPGAKNEYDYWEFGPNLGYDFGFLALTTQYLWSPDFFLSSGDAHWLTAGMTVPMPKQVPLPKWLGIAFSGNIGQQWIDQESKFGLRDYLTWDVGSTISVFGLDVDLRYTDTDVSDNKCFGGGSTFGDLCKARFVATVGKAF
jgi:uncharacterized protein (TIGR02001 family)